MYSLDGTPNARDLAFTPGALAGNAVRYQADLRLADLFNDFIAGSISVANDVTLDNYRRAYEMFAAWLPLDGTTDTSVNVGERAKLPVSAVLGSVSKQLFVDYIGWLERRPKWKGKGSLSRHTVNSYVRPLRTFIRWMVTEAYYPSDPFAGGKRGIMPKAGPRILKLAKVADIVTMARATETRTARTVLEAATHARDLTLVILFSDTGIRTGEACELRVGYRALTRAWQRGSGQKTGFGAHRFRHLYGTNPHEYNTPSHVSQLIMGHTDEKSQRAYQHPSEEIVRREHDRVTPLRQLPATRRRRAG